MRKHLKRVISFGYKVSDGDHHGFAYFLRGLRSEEKHEEKWRDLVVSVIAELPIDHSKQVLKAMLKQPVH